MGILDAFKGKTSIVEEKGVLDDSTIDGIIKEIIDKIVDSLSRKEKSNQVTNLYGTKTVDTEYVIGSPFYYNKQPLELIKFDFVNPLWDRAGKFYLNGDGRNIVSKVQRTLSEKGITCKLYAELKNYEYGTKKETEKKEVELTMPVKFKNNNYGDAFDKKPDVRMFLECTKPFTLNDWAMTDVNRAEVDKYVSLYKNDEDILKLAEKLYSGDGAHYQTYPAKWVNNTLNQFQNGYAGDGNQESKAYFLYSKEAISFVLGSNFRTELRFKENGFAPIDDLDKLEAVAIVIVDKIVENSKRLAEGKGCKVSINYRLDKIYEYNKTGYAENTTFGIVGDENYVRAVEIARQYANSNTFAPDPSAGVIKKGAIISIVNCNERPLKRL